MRHTEEKFILRVVNAFECWVLLQVGRKQAAREFSKVILPWQEFEQEYPPSMTTPTIHR